MLQKISTKAFSGHGPIQTLYPGTAVSNLDSGIGSIGRIDHARFQGTHHIPMHPHVNDEILSYFRTGKVRHLDSEGFSETIGRNRLMLMKAGKLFFHEEWIDGESEPHEGLQIFIRPGAKDLKPSVIFRDIEPVNSEDEWRLLASPGTETSLQFSSQTWIFDVKLSPGMKIDPPVLPAKGLTVLLYVYQGQTSVNETISLVKKESLIIKDEAISIRTTDGAELVLFLTDKNAPIYKGGMYSGNKIYDPFRLRPMSANQ